MEAMILDLLLHIHLLRYDLQKKIISLRSSLFWDLTLLTVIIPRRRFGTTYVSYFQGSSRPRRIITFYSQFGTTCGSLKIHSGTRPCLWRSLHSRISEVLHFRQALFPPYQEILFRHPVDTGGRCFPAANHQLHRTLEVKKYSKYSSTPLYIILNTLRTGDADLRF
jgi:hypothetical protein